MTRRRLVDATLLYDELDLLLRRMRYLDPHVDHFYVAESNESFTGLPKPLHLTENLHLFEEFADRLTVLHYGGSTEEVGWVREAMARETLREAIRGLAADTVVYLSDVDEFPSVAQLTAMRQIDQPHAVPLDTFYRRANWRLEAESPIFVAKATPVSHLPDDLTKLRWPDVELPNVPGERGGHFSYLGFGPDDLATKLAAFSHADEFSFVVDESQRLLKVADRLVLDHFGRSRMWGGGLLTVLQPEAWSSLHHWLHVQRPDWFEVRATRFTLWREVNAAVIDDAMKVQDLEQLRAAGTPRAWLQPGARRVVRSRLRGVRDRLRT